jgi:hypothetical protein
MIGLLLQYNQREEGTTSKTEDGRAMVQTLEAQKGTKNKCSLRGGHIMIRARVSSQSCVT